MNKPALHNKSMTKMELSNVLGISLRTLQRRLAFHKIHVPRGLINEIKRNEIIKKLGYEDPKIEDIG